jgi:hypothetical protein
MLLRSKDDGTACGHARLIQTQYPTATRKSKSWISHSQKSASPVLSTKTNRPKNRPPGIKPGVPPAKHCDRPDSQKESVFCAQTNTQKIMKIENIKVDGAVIDPETGRLCAHGSDLARALGIAPAQVQNTRATKYQGRYYDIQEVLDIRAKTPPPGRPRMIRGSAEIALLCALGTFALSAFAGITLWASAMGEVKAETRVAKLAMVWNPEGGAK